MANLTSAEVYAQLEATRVVPLFYHADAAIAKKILQACYEGGTRVFEFTNRGENAAEVFKELRAFVDEYCPELALGIGTIYTPAEATKFIDLGADFIVQPVTTAAVGEVCQNRNIPWLPAAATLNEIYHALQLGAEAVKLFPANVLGPVFVKAIKGPMPNVKVMITGGVEPTEENMKSWFSAGANYLGMGSQLFAIPLKTDEDFAVLRERVANMMQFVKK
ncbi:MAG: bifunctional 4-hydroxy-2-oxoglutarate aldolase/2-dehydro-3-deoxy-phosphogluconate aldolase [Saprospiraceae bacterium]|nr:bifunctional 4-hydroxy-2-oxoglutarate aldolase/2-dehydro-3-deoxy-phosphogluconate aldolase [Saprospiraceae bacterium]